MPKRKKSTAVKRARQSQRSNEAKWRIARNAKAKVGTAKRSARKPPKTSAAQKIQPASKKKKIETLPQFNPTPRTTAQTKVALAKSDSNSSSCPCEIYLNGSAINSSNNSVLPGQQINLSLSCGGFTPTNIQWSIPGTIFSSWDISPNNSSASIAPVPASAKKATPITFYWSSCGSQNVSVTYTGMDGKTQCTASATINVVQPTIVFDDYYFGKVGLYLSNSQVGPLPQSDVRPGGIKFDVNVTLPSQYPAGKYAIAQLVSPNNAITQIASGSCMALNQNGMGYLLDSTFPYSIPGSPPTGLPTTYYDEPACPAGNNLATKGTFAFETYLMFMPDGGQWIPLAKTSWSYNACATGGPSNWAVKSSTPGTTGPTPSSVTTQNVTLQPTWTGIINLNPSTGYSPTGCPSPFCP